LSWASRAPAQRGQLLVDEPAPGIARLTISNPGKRGALDHAILERFTTVMPELDARCVIITGEGDMFSAGYDITHLAEEAFAAEAESLVARPFSGAIEALEAYPYPTIAALNGHAIGGGLELTVSCDLRIAASGASLAMPPGRLGLVYSHTGLRRFIDIVGGARTRELFLVGRRVDAATALSWGLVNAVHDADRLEAEVLALAGEIAGHAPLAQHGNRRVITALLDARASLDEKSERELIELRAASIRSEDFREGVRAFGEKRPPRWSGR
jgi:enoyl-CoA hydratase/carnithine racemase